MKPHEALQSFWLETGSEPAVTPTGQLEVEALEARFDVLFPDDFRDYLLHAAPRVELMDRTLTTWWPVSRIAREQTEGAPENDPTNTHGWIIFADHMIWCWAWAIACGNTGQRGKIIEIGHKGRIVADDFATFVALNIADDDGLFG